MIWTTPDAYRIRRRAQWRAARNRYYAKYRKEPRPLKDTPHNIRMRAYGRRRYWEQKGER